MPGNRSGLLPTIIPGADACGFPRCPGSALAAHLCAHYSIDAQWAGIAAATAGTDMDLAKTLVNAPETGASESSRKRRADTASGLDWQTTRPWVIRQLCRLISKRGFRPIQAALSLSAFFESGFKKSGPGSGGHENGFP